LHELALAFLEAKLGPDYPDVAKSLINLAKTRSGIASQFERVHDPTKELDLREQRWKILNSGGSIVNET
jgi:hypothetical protein